MNATPEWEADIARIVAKPGTVVVLGGLDVGKTRFCAELANAALEAGLSTAIVDTDVGQSEIGLPGTIGLGFVEKPIESIGEIEPHKVYFVGATSPTSHLVQFVVGAKKLTDLARACGAKLIIVDTTGFIEGPIALRLKTHKIDLLRPEWLAGIQRSHEIEPLMLPFARVKTVRLVRLPMSQNARVKAPAVRAMRRAKKFYDHFHTADEHIIRLNEVSCWNTFFRTGRAMQWQYVKFIERSLQCRILHAELVGNTVFFVSETECLDRGRHLLEEQFHTKDIVAATADSFRDVLVGLADEKGDTMDLGVIEAVDFSKRFAAIRSPIKTISPVRVLQFGFVRIGKDGREIGYVKPGQL